MRKTLIIAIACVLVVGLTATNADATSLTVDSSEYVGYYYPPTGSDNFGDLLILSKLGQGETDTEIGQGNKTYEYSRVGSDIEDPLPTPTTEITTYYVNVAPYTYIVGQYDGDNGGALVWLVGKDGLSVVTLQEWWGPGDKTFRLGSVTMYESMPAVPDGGMTLMLLGGALVALEALRRRSRA